LQKPTTHIKLRPETRRARKPMPYFANDQFFKPQSIRRAPRELLTLGALRGETF
jgi:hypothetical protein